MSHEQVSRRGFPAAAGAASIGSAGALPPAKGKLHLATNEYPWGTFYGREKRSFAESLDTVLGEVAPAGLNGYEPLARSPEDVKRLAPLLRKHGIEMRSLYVNSTLHLPDKAAESIDQALAIAEAARAAGTRIIVTNLSPSPAAPPRSAAENKARLAYAVFSELTSYQDTAASPSSPALRWRRRNKLSA